MLRLIGHWKPILLFAVIGSAVAGCAGKDEVLPIDVEKQAFGDLRREVRDVIDDPAREAEAISLLDALAEDINALRETISERRQRTRQLNANYDTSRVEFEAFFDQIDKEIQSNQQRATKSHRALLAITTPDEWSAISKARTKAMKAAIKSIQAI